MPIPMPKPGEKESDYMETCMSFLKDEGKPHKQSIAICLSNWRKKNENDELIKKIDMMIEAEPKCPEGQRY